MVRRGRGRPAQQLGQPVAPIIFDSIGAYVGAGNVSSGSYTYIHTIGQKATALFACVSFTNLAAGFVISVGSTNFITNIDQPEEVDSGNYPGCLLMGILKPPTGAQTIKMQLASGGSQYFTLNTIAYQGVGGWGTAITTGPSGSSPSLSISAAHTILNVIGYWQSGAGNSYSGYTGHDYWFGGGLLIGDGVGNMTFSCTLGDVELGASYSIGLPLLPILAKSRVYL